VSDVVIYEDYPSNRVAFARRLHRWIRGDWQILPWIGPWVPQRGGWGHNRLSLLSRWKIADNLRRSLVAPSLIAFALLGWTLLPSPWLWTVLVLVFMGTPALTE